MVFTEAQSNVASMPVTKAAGARVLVIESPYYASIMTALLEGVSEELGAADVTFDRVAVPGALEIPQAFRQAVAHGQFGDATRAAKYHGVIVLGCVIRGETSHYDIVCNNANHWLMETAIRHNIPVGNAILTVDTEAQAMARARGGRAGKGGDAARACLRLIHLNRQGWGDGR